MPWATIAAVLLLLGGVLLTMGVRGHQVVLAGPAVLQATRAPAPGPGTTTSQRGVVDAAVSSAFTASAGHPAAAPSPPVAPGDAAPPASAGHPAAAPSPPVPRGHPAPPASPSPSAAAPSPPVPRDAASTAPPRQVASPSTGSLSPVVARSTPVALRIPAIGVSVSLSQLGLNLDGTVQVPTDFAQPGWFRLGPSPGQLGSAVILGHVDSYRGPAVFFRLRELQAGDLVEVSLADGTVAHFVVSTVTQYLKNEFPAQQVYGSHGVSGLQLVTCGGAFDTQARSYLSNVVAYTTLVSITRGALHP
jgi:hypothetical protein